MRKPTGELKSQKLTLAMRPSVVRDIYKVTHMKNNTVNNLINDLLEKYIAENQECIQLFDKYVKPDKK